MMALGGLLVFVLYACLDSKFTILGKHHYIPYIIVLTIQPYRYVHYSIATTCTIYYTVLDTIELCDAFNYERGPETLVCFSSGTLH
jgi:hypothetical protein